MKLISNSKLLFINLFLVAILGGFISSAAAAVNLDSRIFTFQQKLANAGKVKAQYKLALMYETGRGVVQDFNKAKEWYKKSAAKNYKASKHRLNYLEIKSSGVTKKHKVWIKDLISDAKSRDAESMFLLAEMYEHGHGLKKSLRNAYRYYKLAASRGHADSETRLFSLDQKINQARYRQQEKKEAAAKKKKLAQLARAKKEADKNKEVENRKKKVRQLKVLQERKDLAEKLAKKKRNADIKRQQAAKRKAESKNAKDKLSAAKVNEESEFESDMCSGAAARFRTQCN